MKNLNYLNFVESDEFDLIKSSKQKTTIARLNAIRTSVISDYNLYLNKFPTIHQIGNSTYNLEDSKALKGCYTIKTAARDSLLTRIVDIQTTHFKAICPYCLQYPRTTYDHYIPETSYPVYSVLAKNLIPCCTTCNGKKLEYWRENGVRAILHYYNDIIPQIQFLFGELSFNKNNVPYISYKIEQPIGVSDRLFSIIQKHFERLELTNRYSGSIDLVISDIIDDVNVNRSEFGTVVNDQTISNVILKKSNILKGHYGLNYWKSIAMDLLANSPNFINSI